MRISGRHVLLIGTALLLLGALAAAGGLGLVATADQPDSGRRAEPVPIPEPGADKPNVLVIFTDDQDQASLAAMPQVQRLLAAKGTTFANAFASLPQCCPSRATFLSGQYAHNHGVRDNDPPNGGYAAFDSTNAVPVWLHDAGYRTGWIGKYLNGYGNPARGTDPNEVPPGWSDWVAPVLHTEYRMYGYTLNIDGQTRSYGAGPRDYQTDVLARQAETFVRQSARQPQPFFLTVAPLAPHQEGGRVDDRPNAPRNPRPAPRHLGRFDSQRLPRPPSFNERLDGDKTAVITALPRFDQAEIRALGKLYRSRMESLLAVDDMVARLMAAVRQTGQLRDTLIIFTSDQGFLLGEHHLRGKNALYEEAVQVPLVIRGPGVDANAVRNDVVGNVDLAPTIVASTGATPGLPMDGRPLFPAPLRSDPGRRRGLLLEQYHGGRFAGVRSQRYAYLDFGNRGTELYDMRRDPFQLRNRVDDPARAATVERYARLLERLRSCAGPECR